MKKIGIDATLARNNGKGVSRYLINIVRSLSALDRKNEYFIFCDASQKIDFGIAKSNWHFIDVPVTSMLVWQHIQLPFFFKKYNLNLVHTACDNLAWWSGIPFVIYLFEIPDYRLELKQPSRGLKKIYDALAKQYYRISFPRSIRKASLIVTSSEFTKRDLIEKYSADPSKIKVVFSAHEDHFQPCSDDAKLQKMRDFLSGGSKYFLHFATGDPRDNTEVVLKAFERAKRELPADYKLLVVGGNAEKSRKENSIICHGFTTGEKLINLYQAASAYIDPSLFEGFGMQPLEAMAAGAPVIASNVTSIPEVVSDAGILLNPHDIEGFAFSMCEVANSENLRLRLREQGIKRSQFFSWDRTAGQLLNGFEQVLSGVKS